MRSSSETSRAPSAPVALVDPTSSWSYRHTTGTDGVSSGAASRPCSPAKEEQRLSRRGALTNTPSTPVRRDGVRSWAMTSQARTSPAPTPRRSASRPVKPAPAPRSPSRSQIGARCCCAFSRRPSVMISRSRWIASWGTRSSGSSMRTRRSGPVGGGHRHAAGQAEVAVQPRVQQGAAVDLDAELAHAGGDVVRAGLDAQVGAVGVGAHDAERADGTGRLAPRDQRAAPAHVAPAGAAGQRLVERDLAEPGALEQAPLRSRRRGTARGSRR